MCSCLSDGEEDGGGQREGEPERTAGPEGEDEAKPGEDGTGDDGCSGDGGVGDGGEEREAD